MAFYQTKVATVDGRKILEIAVDGQNVLRIDPQDFTADIREDAMIHGFKQKHVDAMALGRDANGRSASTAEKYHAMMEVNDTLHDGDWNKRAEGDGSGNAALLVAALMRLSPDTPKADVESTVKAWTRDEVDAMKLDSTVAPVIAAIKAERAARKPVPVAKVDVTAKLAAFLGRPTAQVDAAPKAAKAKKAA